MKLKSLILAAAATVMMLGSLQAASAASGEVPRLDPVAFCSEGIDSQAIINACVEEEQRMYNILKAAWPKLPQSAVDFCVAPGLGYAIIAYCVESELEALENKTGFTY